MLETEIKHTEINTNKNKAKQKNIYRQRKTASTATYPL